MRKKKFYHIKEFRLVSLFINSPYFYQLIKKYHLNFFDL